MDFSTTVVTDLSTVAEGEWDGLVIVSEDLEADNWPNSTEQYQDILTVSNKNDPSVESGVNVFFPENGSIGWMVYSGTGPVNRDYDDVRRFSDAIKKAITRAVDAEKKNLLLVIPPSKEFSDSTLVSLLAAFETLYVPLEIREVSSRRSVKINKLGIVRNKGGSLDTYEDTSKVLEQAIKLEVGRIVARDIGGSDPERMAPPRVAEYLTKLFNDSVIKMDITSGQEKFRQDYPLLAAVDRCASVVERHRGRLITLEYDGTTEGETRETFIFVGKGITYDTGGADVKAGGHMAGMHRDKCGAATVAGLFATLSEFKPPGIKAIALLSFVRNSIGADAYVADEIITSKAGVRVRVGNTDAEGRMVMADPLFHAKERAMTEVNPHLFTVATLTGHAIIAMGESYSIVIENGPAAKKKFAEAIQGAGHDLGEPFEISRLRREDFDFVKARNEYEDVLQCNNEPSSQTPRGHQFPAAFMMRASGVDQHGCESKHPLPYSHVDIAGSSGPYPGIPTGSPIVAFARMMKFLPRLVTR